MLQPRAIAKLTGAFLLGLGAVPLVREILPPYEATFILISEAEISDVEISFEGRPVPPDFFHFAKDRLFAWDSLVARGTRPDLEVAWRGPDGHTHSIRQRMLHEPSEPRCIYILRLDAAGLPAPVGSRPNSIPLMIDDSCR